MGLSKKQGCIFATIVIAFIITISCIIASVSVLDLLYVGLDRSEYSKSFDNSRLYSPGRYFLGLGRNFVEFPSTTQVLVFSDTAQTEKDTLDGAKFNENSRFYPSVNVRTLEGLKVKADVLVYYKLGYPDASLPVSQQIHYLYEAFGLHYDKFVEMVTVLELRNVIGGYSASQFITNRRDMNQAFKTKLRTSLSEDYILLTSASISNLKFPDAYDDSIESTIIAQQNVTTMGYELQAEQVMIETQKQAADKDAQMTQILATAEGDGLFRQAQAISNATEYVFQEKGKAVDAVLNNLGFVDDAKFSKGEKALTYFWMFLQWKDNMNTTNKYLGAIKSYEFKLLDEQKQ